MILSARSRSIFLMALAVFSAGCSTVKPMQAKRQGLFDKMSKMEPANSAADRDFREDEDEDSREVYPSLTSGEEETLKKLAFRWPLKAIQVTSPYGKRGHEFHEGVDLRARTGTPVYAAQSGVVIYAAKRISGYGKMIVIRHQRDISTVYAHNSKLIAKKGQRVNKGQIIALSGKTGKARGPHLHFELRKGTSALNPLAFMPRSAVAEAQQVNVTKAQHKEAKAKQRKRIIAARAVDEG